MWQLGLAYSVVALVVTLADAPRWYVADNRFEQYFNPAGTLGKLFATWDPSRGLGMPRDDVWLASTIPVGLMRLIGLSPMLAERGFHAACLVTFGLGVVTLMRQFRPRLGAEHVLAGLLAMFNPYSASFLVPSNLFLMTALSPWLAVAFVNGIRGSRPWRWSACFALIVFAAGNSDMPGLIYAMLMILPLSVYVVAVERSSTWTRVALWLLRAGVLTLICCWWTLTKTRLASDELAARLAETEQPATSALTSSWSESVRGLGNWLSYFREDGRLIKPQTVFYFEQPLVILATFALPVFAMVVIWRSRWPGRIAFAMMMLTSLAVMVGGFGADAASPFGRSFLWVLEHNDTAASFRNTYKAGGGLVIGTSVLGAVGAVHAYRTARRFSKSMMAVTVCLGVTLFATAAAPFSVGGTYQPFERLDSVPTYWHDAFDYLDAMPSEGRSLIVPAVSQTEYRWGYVGDDIFDALLERPHATATGWMLSRAESHNAIEAITLASQSPNYRPGVIGPMARRLGVSEIVIRNDVDWSRSHVARPADFEQLRSDPDLELVAVFGDPGTTNVVSDLDLTSETTYERTLPPVEVYRVRDATGPLVAQDRPTLVVAGDAHAWPLLATAGLLDDDPFIAASGGMSDAMLENRLLEGATVAITDTARRRTRTLLRHELQLSPTLADGQTLDREPRPLYPEYQRSESVAWFRDALTIEGSYVTLGGNRNDLRPANAFDGDPSTAWAVPATATGGQRPSLKVEFRRPQAISHLIFTASRTPAGRPTLRSLNVTFSDGSDLDVDLGLDGVGDVSIPPRSSTSLTISITEVSDLGADVGLSEVVVDGVDLVEYIESPRDLEQRTDPTVRRALAGTPTAYLFRRVARAVSASRFELAPSRFDEEVTLRRRFEILHDEEFEVSGTIRGQSGTSEELLASILATSTSAISNHPGGAVGEGAVNAIDGDTATHWVGGARPDSGLTVEFRPQPVESVVITVPTDAATARIRRIIVEAGGVQVIAPVRSTCRSRRGQPCTAIATAEFPQGTTASAVTVSVLSLTKSIAGDNQRVRISEVSVKGGSFSPLDRSAPLFDGCLDLGLSVSSESGTNSVRRARVVGTVGELLSSEPIPFEGCDPVELPSGDALVRTSPGSPIDELRLVPRAGMDTSPAGHDAQVDETRRSPDRIDGVLVAQGPTTISLRSSFDPGWTLEIDGVSIPAEDLDTVNSWRVPSGGTKAFTIRFEPASRVRHTLTLSIACVLLCVGLAFWPRRVRLRRSTAGVTSETDPPPLPGEWEGVSPSTSIGPTHRSLHAGVPIAIATLLGVLLLGPMALAVGAGTAILNRYWDDTTDWIGLVPVIFLGLAGIWSAFGYPSASVGLGYATERWGPSVLTQLGVVFLLQTIGVAATQIRFADRGQR